MKQFFKTKWLALALLICAPLAAWADDDDEMLVDLTTLSGLTEVTNDCGSISTNEGTITMTFTTDCFAQYLKTKGIGWQSSSPDYLDLTGYSEIIVSYSNFTTDYYESDIQLYVVDSSGYGAAVQSSDGTIDFVISENSSGYGQGWNGNGTIDYSSIEAILICVHLSSSASVDINSIQLKPSSSSSSGEGEGEGGSGEDNNSGSNSGSTEDNSTYEAKWDLSTQDADFTGVEANDYSSIYKIDGDGTSNGQHNTLVFPNEMSGTYWVALHNVTINTSGRTTTTESDSKGMHRAGAYFTEVGGSEERTDSCGIYIPASTEDSPLTINMVIDGHSTIDASKYGIYVGENSQLNIIYIDDQISDYTQNSKDPDTYTLTIGGSSNLTYGIYNEGKHMFIHTVDADNTSQEDGNVLVGTTTITATDCGIYSYNGVDIKDTYMIITVTGNGEVESTIPEENTYDDYFPGYSITKLVCGIYVADKGGENHGTTISMIDLTITAKGTHTYGIFLENATSYADAYFGFGSVTITATQCVLHHEGQYNGYIPSGEKLILTLIGPFCEHIGLYQDWYCDEVNGSEAFSGNFVVYIILDGIDMNEDYTGFNLSKQTEVGEVEYVGRKLYPGWNTVCLPYAYKINSTTDEDDTYYDFTEARKVITAYAKYKETTTVDGESTITFEYIDTSDEDAALSSDTAYLMYVPDYTEDENGNKTYKNFTTDYTQVQFTAMNTDLYVVKNRDNTTEVAFDPVFNAETMNGDAISGDDSNNKHYKLTAHNKYQNNSTGEIVTDEEASSSSNAGSAYTEGYTYVGIDNFFNKTSSETTFPAFRCYIDVDASSETAEATKLATAFVESSVDEGSEETTGINQLGGTLNAIDGDAVVSVYGLNGQLVKVASAKTATNGLAKGVYVVGGKKVVVM
ncbi:MAG: hypothetical protein LUI08_02650 [Prevotella sp.]|nr:hypothetical protein [Prevotella sp.]